MSFLAGARSGTCLEGVTRSPRSRTCCVRLAENERQQSPFREQSPVGESHSNGMIGRRNLTVESRFWC